MSAEPNPIPPLHLYSVPSDPQPAAKALAESGAPAHGMDGRSAHGRGLPRAEVGGARPPRRRREPARRTAQGRQILALPRSRPRRRGRGQGVRLGPRRRRTGALPRVGGHPAPSPDPYGQTLGRAESAGRAHPRDRVPALPQGGTEAIAQWLDRNPDARMVVIDVFAKMRGQAPQGVSAYDADYVSVGYAKRLADHYGIAVVLVHHVRKAGSDDFLTRGLRDQRHRGRRRRHARTQAGPRAGRRHPARHRTRRRRVRVRPQLPTRLRSLALAGRPRHRPHRRRHPRRDPPLRPCPPRRQAQGHGRRAAARRHRHHPPDLLAHGRCGQLTKDAGGRYYPDTDTRTQTTPEVSALSDCPVTPSDQHEQPGQSELELSGLSGSTEAEGTAV